MLKFYLTILFLGYASGNSASTILETIYHLFSGFLDYPQPLPNNQERASEKYSLAFDFVVIGAGSAGSVLANRLTENPDWRVLLLEEGNEESLFTDIPILAATLHSTNYSRLYKSEPRPEDANGRGGSCLSMVDGRCTVLTGKAVGGTSVVNFMIYSRGTPGDYDAWRALDNPGWSYEEVLPYFIKSEKCRLTTRDERYILR